MNSRLNLNLREDKGLVYSVESAFSPFRTLGYLSIYFAAAENNLEVATRAIAEEIEILRTTPIPESELRLAKRQIVGQMAVQEDNRESAFLEMGKSFLYFNKFDTLAQVRERIDQLTSAELQSIAREIFVDERALQLTYR